MTKKPQKSQRYDEGMATRRSVLGAVHVDRASAAMSDFDEPFQTFITEGAWGSVWSRPQLTKRERSIVTIALLAALGHDEEVAMHARATANTGATQGRRLVLRRERRRVPAAIALVECPCISHSLHVAVYAGVPAANRAFKIVKKTYAEMADAKKA